MSRLRFSIIGLGWLGLPLTRAMRGAGHSVHGSVTSAEKAARLADEGLATYRLTLKPQPEGDLAPLLDTDVLLINVPPRAGKQGDDFHPEQLEHLTRAIRQSPVKHVVYVSSTSVYPEANRIVTEDDVAEPAGSGAPALVRAEKLVQALAPERAVTVLRCAGLMGYDRIPGKYVAGRAVESGAVPVNYVHRDDAVALIRLVLETGLTGVYNVVAPEHPTREAVYRRSCEQFGYALPQFVEPAEPVPFKIVGGEKLARAVPYDFIYPNPLDFYYAQA